MIWYAVHTKPRKEGLVRDLLQYQGYETLYLHFWAKTKHARRTRLEKRSLFSRYIFAGLANGQTISAINRTIGVSTVVYLGDEPLKIPSPVIEELRARGDENGMVRFTPKEAVEHRKRFREGERVRITGGPLEGFFAIVGLDRGHEISVWLQMFGGKVEAFLDPAGLRGVSPERGFVGIPKRRRI